MAKNRIDTEEMPTIIEFETKQVEEMPASTEFETENIKEMPASTVLKMKNAEEMPASTELEMQNTEEVQGSTEVDIRNVEEIPASTAFAMKMIEEMPARSSEVEVKNLEVVPASSELEIKITKEMPGNCELEIGIAGEGEDIAVAPEAAFEFENGKLELPPGTVIFSPDSKMKIRSRYLRSSLSSCHDLCKYGAKDFTEAKGESFIQNKTISTLGQDQNVEKTTSPTGATRQKVTFYKPSPLAVKNEFASCILRKDIIIYGSSSSSRNTNASVGKEMQPLKIGQKEVSRPSFSVSPKKYSIKKTDSMDNDKPKNLKRTSRLKDGKNAVKVETEQESEEIEEKIINVVEPEANKKRDGSTLTQNGSNATGLSPFMADRANRTSNCSLNRPQAKATLSTQSSNLRKSRNGIPKTRLAPTLSFPESRNSRRSSHFVRSSSVLSPGSIITEENSPNREQSESATPKQSKTMKQEHRSTTAPKKPSSRKGMASYLQAENNDARRLRFQQTKPACESTSGKIDTRKRRFARKEVDSGPKSPDTKSEKVVLRHQDVNEKKDAKDYNNVIKETASKLVKTRKSKVKALVGAFETVISLQ